MKPSVAWDCACRSARACRMAGGGMCSWDALARSDTPSICSWKLRDVNTPGAGRARGLWYRIGRSPTEWGDERGARAER